MTERTELTSLDEEYMRRHGVTERDLKGLRHVFISHKTPTFIRVVTKGYLYMFNFRNIKQHHDSVTAQVTACRQWEEMTEQERGRYSHLMPYTYQVPRLNLLASRSVADFAKNVAERDEVLKPKEWNDVFSDACQMVVDSINEGEPVLEIDGGIQGLKPPKYLAGPLIMKDTTNIIFGLKASCKTTTAAAVSCVVQNEMTSNPLELVVNSKANVLWLDYEFTYDAIQYDFARIQKGFNLDDTAKIKYRRCRKPIIEEFDKIRDIIKEYEISLAVIDSLGLAAGSDNLKEARAATDFYTALNQIDCTFLILAHSPKSEYGQPVRSVLGSSYFENLARNIWYIEKASEEGTDEVDILLRNKWVNTARQHKPISFHINYTDESICIFGQDFSKVDAFRKYVPLKQRIIAYLLSCGSAEIPEITKVCESKEQYVRTTLNRNKNVFVKKGKEWAVLAHQ